MDFTLKSERQIEEVDAQEDNVTNICRTATLKGYLGVLTCPMFPLHLLRDHLFMWLH